MLSLIYGMSSEFGRLSKTMVNIIPEACVCVSCSAVSDWLCNPILCPWNSPSKNTGVVCHSLLQGIFPIQQLNPGLLHSRQILYCPSYQKHMSSIFHVDNTGKKKKVFLHFYHLYISSSKSTQSGIFRTCILRWQPIANTELGPNPPGWTLSNAL